MILKKKPQKPKRKTHPESMNCDGASLQSIVDWVHSFDGAELKEVTIDSYRYGSHGEEELEASFNRTESDKEFQARVTSYQRKLKIYNGWYAANKKEIEAELVRRQELFVARSNRNVAAERVRLQKRLAQLDKKKA
jgi:hypothetical protein